MSADEAFTLAFEGGAPPPWLLDVELVPGAVPSIKVVNGARRYLRIDLFQQPVVEAGGGHSLVLLDSLIDADDGWRDRLLSSSIHLRHLVSAQDDFPWAFPGLFGQGTKLVPLVPPLSSYRLEIVGPSVPLYRPGFDPAIPERYQRPYEDYPGQSVVMYDRLALFTLVTQIFVPIISVSLGVELVPSAVKIGKRSMKWDTIFTVLETAGDWLTANTAGSTTGITLASFIQAFIYLLENPSVLPAAGQLVVELLEAELGDALFLAFVKRLNVWISAAQAIGSIADLSFALYSLSVLRPCYNVIVKAVPDRMQVQLPASVEARVGDQITLDVTIAWPRYAQLASTGGEPSMLQINTSSRWAGQASLVNGALVLDDLYVETAGVLRPVDITVTLETNGLSYWGRPVLETFPWFSVQDHAGPVPFDFVPSSVPLFRADHVGPGSVVVTVVNRDPMFPPSGDSELRTCRAEMPVNVSRGVGQVAGQPVVLNVGDRRHARFSVSLSSGEVFTSNAPFAGNIETDQRGSYIHLKDLIVPISAGGAEVPFPCEITLVRSNTSEQAGFRFEVPDAGSLRPDGRRNFDNLGAYIHGLRTCEESFDINVYPQFPDYDINSRNLSVIVQHVALELEVTSEDDPDSDGRIIIESDYDSAANQLFGSFHLTIRRSGATTPLYESEQSAYLSGTWSENRLDVASIHISRPNGEATPVPVGFTAVLLPDGSSPLGAAFTLRGAPQGDFQIFGDLPRCLRAVGEGGAILEVRLRLLDGPDAEVYELPQPCTIPVWVPGDMAPTMTSWFDYWAGSRSLDTTPEIISSNGEVSGVVEGFRPTCRNHRIKLRVRMPDGVWGPEVVLADPGGNATVGNIEADGSWSAWVDVLAGHQVINQGDYELQLTAWKPIHSILNGPGSEGQIAQAAVRGVAPIDVAFENPPEGDVYRRDLPDIFATAGRCRKVRILCSPALDNHYWATDETGGSFDTAEVHFTGLRLAAQTGEHRLWLHAENDFSEVEASAPAGLWAPEPTIIQVGNAEPLKSNGDPGTVGPEPDQFGYSSEKCSVTFECTATTGLEAKPDQASEGEWAFIDQYEGTREPRQHTLELPLWGGFSVGLNEFKVKAYNEFGEATATVRITRRGNVWDIGQVTIVASPVAKGRDPNGPGGYIYADDEWVWFRWAVSPTPDGTPLEVVAKRVVHIFTPLVTSGASPIDLIAPLHFYVGGYRVVKDENNNDAYEDIPTYLKWDAVFTDREWRRWLWPWAPTRVRVMHPPPPAEQNEPVRQDLWPTDGSAEYYAAYTDSEDPNFPYPEVNGEQPYPSAWVPVEGPLDQ